MPIYLDITPSNEEYRRIAERLLGQLVCDWRTARRTDDRAILKTFVQTAVYLANVDRAQYDALLDAIDKARY